MNNAIVSSLPLRTAILVVASALLLGFTGKEITESAIESGDRTEIAPVEWPELVAFSEIADQAGELAAARDREGILRMRTALLESGWAVSPRTMPQSLPNYDRVHFFLGRLSSLVNGFARSEMSDERLFGLAEGLGSVVDGLIDESGISHRSLRIED